jgi:hypothetical protein
MTAKMRGRLILDVALCALLVFVMLRPLTGQVAHEIAGALLLAGMIAHVTSGWGAATRTARRAREATRPQRVQGLLAVMVVLGVAGVALLLSALVISRLLMGAGSHLSDVNVGHLWSRVHIVSAYVLCIAVLAHLVLYWTKVIGALRGNLAEAAFKPVPRILWYAFAVAGVFLVVLGISALNGYGARQASLDAALSEQAMEQDAASGDVNAGDGAGATHSPDDGLGVVSLSGEGTNDADDNATLDAQMGKAKEPVESDSATYPPGHPPVPAEYDGKCSVCHS